MTTLKPVVRKPRTDGLYSVYIRVVHNRKPGYIKTNKIVHKEHISKEGDITDPVVNEYCAHIIRRYTDRLNRLDTTQWEVKEVVDYLQQMEIELCFSDYAREYISKMRATGHMRNARNYASALRSLELFVGTTQVMFDQLTSIVLTRWIESMKYRNRCKEQYPVCLRQVFKEALLQYNDEEKGIKLIKFNPWPKVKIPKADKTEQRAISAEECREFFNRPLPESKMRAPLPELGRDIAKMVLCLGGINTVDLYNLKKSDFRGGKICYKRAKTKFSRNDEAYIEMRVEPYIQALFDKYLSEDSNDEYLFSFHNRYSNSDSFCSNVNSGIKKICKDMGMDKEDFYCVYTFRHTWATIAQNDCGANLSEVGFGMNHSHGMRVTRGYVKIDFSPAWRLNAKVIDFIFYSDKPSKQGEAKDLELSNDIFFRISPKRLIYGRAYYKGSLLAELTDIGFPTIDSVITVLSKMLPSDIPNGATVDFRLQDVDKGTEAVYERTKGKGF